MFCWHFSYNLCTKASLVDNKPHFLQPCQIFCTVSWELVHHSEWKNVKVVGMFTFCSFFKLLMMTGSLIYSHNISWFCLCDWSYFSVKGNYASSTRRALACFFSHTTNWNQEVGQYVKFMIVPGQGMISKDLNG